MPKSKFFVLMDKLSNIHNNWEQQYRLIKLTQQQVPKLDLNDLSDVQRHFHILAEHLLNVRSKVSKQASQLVCLLCFKFKTHLCISEYMIKQSLKGLATANTVLRQYANQALISIICQCKPDRAIPILIQFFESKNNYVREKISEYFLILIEEADIRKHKKGLSQLIEKGLVDKVEVIRRNMRKIFILFQQQYPDIRHILTNLDSINIKLIQDQAKTRKTSRNSLKHEISIQLSSQSNKQNQQYSRGIMLKQKVYLNSQQSSSRGQKSSIPHLPSISRQKSSEINFKQQSIPSQFASYILPMYLSKRQKKNQICSLKPKTQRNQSIQFLIEKIQFSTWNTRLLSLMKLGQIIQSKQYQQLINNVQRKLIIKSIISRLEDVHKKVSQKAIQVLIDIFPYYSNECFEHCYLIIKRCIRGIIQKSRGYCDELLSILKAFDLQQVFNSVIKLIQHCKNNQKIICLDIIIQALQCDCGIVQTKQVNHLFKLMTNLIVDNKSASIPALAVISILKTHHESKMWSCFINLSDVQLNKMLQLASEIDPLLESIIINYRKTNPKTIKHLQNNYSKKRQLSLLNIQQWDSLSRSPQFINEYIDLIYQKVKYGQDPPLQRLSVVIRDNQYLQQQSLYKLFDMLHLSSNETILLSVNSILDLLVIQSNETFVRCLCEVIKLAKGIHLDMYLQKLKNLMKITMDISLQQFSQNIVDAILIHLESESLELRRTCIMILAELSTKVQNFALDLFKPRQRRLIEKYAKQIL